MAASRTRGRRNGTQHINATPTKAKLGQIHEPGTVRVGRVKISMSMGSTVP